MMSAASASTDKSAPGIIRREWMGSIIKVLLIVSLAINLLLALKVRDLRDHVSLIRSEGRLQAGTFVPSFFVRDVDQRPVLIEYQKAGVPTVLYIFAPGCEWCKYNVPNIKSLAAQAGTQYRVIGLSLSSEDLRDHIAQEGLGFPVYTDVSFQTGKLYKLGGTPQTIVISPTGEVLKNWSGAYENALEREIEEYFQADLPGVAVQ